MAAKPPSKRSSRTDVRATLGYRALAALSYPTDPEVLKRIAAARARGERLPLSERGELRRVNPGEVVTDIPAGSVSWLLAQGHIERVVEEGTNG